MKHIGLSLGHVLHAHHGLAEYCRQLCQGLADRAGELNRQGWQLHFHLPRPWHGVFGDQVGYLDATRLQKFVHLQRQPLALWHVLHQHNRYRVPVGRHRIVETILDLHFLYQKAPPKIARYRAKMQRRIANRDALITISKFVGDDVRRELTLSKQSLDVIYIGVTDLTTLAQEPVSGVTPGTYLFHVSRLAPPKNTAAMLDLAAIWPEQRFVFAGGQSAHTDQLRATIAERGLANVSIHLDVNEAQKAWLYANCRGFLFPSLSEGFGLPPIEAMHFGKTAFLSRLTSLPEVGGDAAYYFDSFDAPSMRAAIEQGLARDEAAPRLAQIRAQAQQFTWSRCVDEHIALYERLLHHR